LIEIETWMLENENMNDTELLIQAQNMLLFFTEGEVLDEYDVEFMATLAARVNLTL